MTGDWIAVVARGLTRPHTYDLTVSPALADLQIEARTQRPLRLVSAYVAAWRALAGALGIDLGADVTFAFRSQAAWSAWRAAAFVYATLLTLNVWVNWPSYGVDELGLDGYTTVFAWRLPAALTACLPGLLVPVAVVLTRRLDSALRPVLLAATIVSLMFVTVSFTVVVPATRTADQYLQAAVWRGRMDASDPPRPLETVRRELTVPLTREDQRRARADRDQFQRHDIVSRGVAIFAVALIGLGLGRKRAWRAGLWAAACLICVAVVVGAVAVYERAFLPSALPVGTYPWARTIALLAMATFMMLLSRRDSESAAT